MKACQISTIYHCEAIESRVEIQFGQLFEIGASETRVSCHRSRRGHVANAVV